MKAAYKLKTHNHVPRDRKPEPGRMVGSTHIPNRIFRGKIIEELRDAPSGLTMESIGRRVCLDWSPEEHRSWIKGVLQKLCIDRLIEQRGRAYVLSE